MSVKTSAPHLNREETQTHGQHDWTRTGTRSRSGLQHEQWGRSEERRGKWGCWRWFCRSRRGNSVSVCPMSNREEVAAGRGSGGGGKSDTGQRQAEPPGSNPILARYTLSPVNHNSVLGAPRRLEPLPPEAGMKPLRRTSARAQAPLSSSSSRRPHTPPKDARRRTASGCNCAPTVILALSLGGQPTGDKTGRSGGIQNVYYFRRCKEL